LLFLYVGITFNILEHKSAGMPEVQLEIPEKLRLKATSLGETGAAWLADLPERVANLERR
jgi:hypothetical protein